MSNILLEIPVKLHRKPRRKSARKKAVGRRTDTPVVQGDKAKSRMVRVHVDFANYLVKEADRQTKSQGRFVTMTEVTHTLYRKLAK